MKLSIDESMTKAEIVEAINQAVSEIPELADIPTSLTKAELVKQVNDVLNTYAEGETTVDSDTIIEPVTNPEPAIVDKVVEQTTTSAAEEVKKTVPAAKPYRRPQVTNSPEGRVLRR